jgi:hypothetical protein
MVSIPALMLAGAASADVRAPAKQRPAPWTQRSTAQTCVDSGACRAAYKGDDGLETHVLTKAEARAELDAIRLDRTDDRIASRTARYNGGE